MKTSKTTDADKSKVMSKSSAGSIVGLKGIIFGAIAAILVIAMIVGMALENFKPRLVMTVGKEKIYMNDAMYYIYQTEANYNYYDQFYRAYYGSSYWDIQGDSGVSNRDSAKTEVQNAIEQSNILYQEAVKAGYEVNDDDKKKAAKDVKEIRKALTVEQKNKTGMTKGALTKALEKKYCADRYKQDIIDGFDIDDAKIREGIKKADFRQYDVQYYFISTKSYDEEGQEKELDKKTKANYKAEMEELAKRAASEDFGMLTPDAEKATKEAAEDADSKEDKEEDSKEESSDATKYNATYTADGKFVVGDNTFTSDVEAILTKMENGQISDVIEGEDGYYLVKMINNDDEEAYENEVKSQISTEETNQFNDWYEGVFKNYTVKVNEKVWNEVTMGKMVLK